MSELIMETQDNETVKLHRDINETLAAIHQVENRPWTATNPIFALSAHLSEIQDQLQHRNGEDLEFLEY